MTGPHRFNSENNVYIGNRAPTASVIFAEDVQTKLVIVSDTISNNTANMAAFYAGSLSSVHINDTKFINNTSVAPLLYVANSVNTFVCSKSIFKQNLVDIDGILSIVYAEQFILNLVIVKNNFAAVGAMIKITESINTTVTLSKFGNNLCSNRPCSLSIHKTDQVDIDQCLFIDDMEIMSGFSHTSSNAALDIQANYVSSKNMQFKGIPGYVYKGVAGQKISAENVTYECRENHVLNSKLINKYLQPLGSSPNDLENVTMLTLECKQCALHHYSLGLPSFTLEDTSSLYNQNATGICYKCPQGGICSGHSVIAYPNYCGFQHQDRLHFVYCLDGFCCQPGFCVSYNGCNIGREGKICTSCANGFQLAIVSNDCLQTNTCEKGWLYGIIIITGLVYVGFLLLKVEIVNILQDIYNVIITRCTVSKNHRATYFFSGEVEIEVPKSFAIQSEAKMTESRVSQSSINPWRMPFDQAEIFQLLVFHLQDTKLFEIRLPEMPNSSFRFDEYKEKIVSMVRFNSLGFVSQFACFPEGWTQINKLLFNTSTIPFMILMILLCMMVIKLLRLSPPIQNRLMSSLYTVLLLIVLFSSQLLSTLALNFINCEWLGSGKYLYIDTTVECYQPWQFFVYCYIGIFIICIVLYLAHLYSKE